MSKEFQSFFWPFGVRCPGCQYELERKIAVPEPFIVYGLTRSEIEAQESDILVCPSECGYFEYAPADPLTSWITDLEPKPEPEPKIIQLPLPLEFFGELPQPPVLRRYNRQRPKLFLTSPFPSSYTQLYSQFLLAEISAQRRERDE